MYIHYAIYLLKQEFHYKCEGTTAERVLKEYPHETHYICKKHNEQKQLEVAIETSANNYNNKKKKEQQ